MDVAPDATLYWDRGALEAECDRAAVVREGVETYLGRSVFAVDGSLVVRVRLERVQEAGRGRVVARVSQEDASGKVWGERLVGGDETCSSLDEPLTLVVALMVDSPQAPPTEPESQPSPAPKPASEPPPPSIPAEDDQPEEIQTAPNLERALTSPGHAAFLGLGLVSMGALPEPGAGAGLVALIKPRNFWALGVEAELLAPQRQNLGSGRLVASLLLTRASICPLQGRDGGVWWSACASFGVARLRVESQQLLEAKTRGEWIAVPSGSVRAAWVFDERWMLAGGLEAVFPVSPDHYVYRDDEGLRHQAFEMSPLTVTANLGIGVIVE
jgi:hypothetical protein